VKRWQRALVVLLALSALFAVGKIFALDQYLHASRMRQAVDSAGSFGSVLFVAIFVAAVLAQIPGIPFVLIAPALFPLPKAWFLCTLASNISVLLGFELVRRIGGSPLAEIEQPLLRRILASLDTRPVLSVTLLRTLTIMFPPVTSALALTQLRARDHALGSAIGMLLPVTALLLLGSLLTR